MAQTYYVQENNTPISELVAQGLADGDTIQLQGKNLVVDIITCGSADPDFTDEINIGVTIKNDGGGECNLEFKDLSGIRLNATLPGTVHPWVDPDHPLPVRLEDGDPRIIHNDPYCTKLTANARAEIQAPSDGSSICIADALLLTETREGEFYGIIKSSEDEYHLTFEKDFPLHKGDIIQCYGPWNICKKYKVINYSNKTVELNESIYRRISGDIWVLCSGGICINCFNKTYSTSNPIFRNKLKAGTIIFHNFTGAISTTCIIADRLLDCGSEICRAANILPDASIYVNQICTISDLGSGYKNIKNGIFGILSYGYTSSYTGILKIYNGIVSPITATWPVTLSNIFIFDFYNFTNNYQTLNITTDYQMMHFHNSYYLNNSISDKIIIKAGTIEKSSNTWHHKPNSATATTWKYADHYVPPHKSLHLKISRMVEAASSSSEARVAITDTVNWYPETKYGALAEKVISGIEPDKWQTYSLKWRNDSDEPQQVRVWECASGSTDGGYLRVEEARGGAF